MDTRTTIKVSMDAGIHPPRSKTCRGSAGPTQTELYILYIYSLLSHGPCVELHAASVPHTDP